MGKERGVACFSDEKKMCAQLVGIAHFLLGMCRTCDLYGALTPTSFCKLRKGAECFASGSKLFKQVPKCDRPDILAADEPQAVLSFLI